MHLKAHFLPYWPSNPYQPLLASGLSKEGVAVQTSTQLKALTRDSSRTATPQDVVHLHWLPLASLQPRAFASWLLFPRRLSRLHRNGIPVVWTAHNVMPHESKLPTLDLWLSRKVAQLADRIICHSAAARAEIIARLSPNDPSKVCVIPHGNYVGSYPNLLPAATCRTKLSLATDAQVFLFLGLIRPYKGIFELIEAFSHVDSPKARLVIAGKPYSPEINQQVLARASLDSRIIYRPGFVADEDIQLYLNTADAVVFPYQKSLTSGALILAMSYGRACIAPRLPGMLDCLTESGGILYDTTSPNGLLDALTSAVSQYDQLAVMGARNLARAQSWDWQTIARATAACYREARAVCLKAAGLG